MPGYLIKTANFVAEISNDDELTQLAQVDTIQKDTMICQLPGKTWIEAKKLPILRKVWGLDAVANVPPPIQAPADSDVPAIKSKLPPSLKTVVAQNPYFTDDPEQDSETTVRPAPDFSNGELESGIQELTSADISVFEIPDEDTTGVMPHGSHELGAPKSDEDNISCDIPTDDNSDLVPPAPVMNHDAPADDASETESHESGQGSAEMSDDIIPNASPSDATYVIDSSRIQKTPDESRSVDGDEPRVEAPSSDAPAALDDDVQPFISVPEHIHSGSDDTNPSLSQDYILLGLIHKKPASGQNIAGTEGISGLTSKQYDGPRTTLMGISAIPPLSDGNKSTTGIPAFKASSTSSDPLTIRPFTPGMKAQMPAIAEPSFLSVKSDKVSSDANYEIQPDNQFNIFNESFVPDYSNELSVVADCRELLGRLDEAERQSSDHGESRSISFPVLEIPKHPDSEDLSHNSVIVEDRDGESAALDSEQISEDADSRVQASNGDAPAPSDDSCESESVTKPLEITGRILNPEMNGDESCPDDQKSHEHSAIEDETVQNSPDETRVIDNEPVVSPDTPNDSEAAPDAGNSEVQASESEEAPTHSFEDSTHKLIVDRFGVEKLPVAIQPEIQESSNAEANSDSTSSPSRLDPNVSAEMLETIEFNRDSSNHDDHDFAANESNHGIHPLELAPLSSAQLPTTEDTPYVISHEETTNQLPAMDDTCDLISDGQIQNTVESPQISRSDAYSDDDQSSQTRNRVRSRRISHRSHNNRCPSANVRDLQRFRELPDFVPQNPDEEQNSIPENANSAVLPTAPEKWADNLSPDAVNVLQHIVKKQVPVIEGRLPANENDMTVSMEPFYATHAAENDQTISMEPCKEIKPNIPSEFQTAKAAVEAAIRAASQKGHVDDELLRSAVSFVDALDSNHADTPEDDSPSDIARIRDRKTLKLASDDEEGSTITHRYQNKREEEYPIPDDDISSDHVTVRGRSELRRMLAEEEKAAETDSIQNLHDLSTEDYCRKTGGEIRKLFQEHDELHLILANDVRERELEVEKEQAQEGAGPHTGPKRATISEDSLMASMPVRNSSIVAAPLKKADPEPTKIISQVYHEPSDNKVVQVANKFVEEKLYQDEVQLTEFDNLYLTSKRLFSIDVKDNAVTNYEAFDIESIQSFGIHEEQRIYFIVIALILILAFGVMTAIHTDPVSIGCLTVSVLLLPLACMLAFRKVMVFNCNSGKVIKSHCAISDSNRQAAMEFLNHFDAARVECRSQLLKAARR